MLPTIAFTSLAFAFAISAQQVGTQLRETHPKLSVQKCTKSGCTTTTQSVVLDANWRWLHSTTGFSNYYTGNTWNASLCSDGKTCAQRCSIEGADYADTYDITSSGRSSQLTWAWEVTEVIAGSALTLKFVTGENIGSRVYLMDSSDGKYQIF
jgi:cellulose 1,4-beta-cellobiosidase